MEQILIWMPHVQPKLGCMLIMHWRSSKILFYSLLVARTCQVMLSVYRLERSELINLVNLAFIIQIGFVLIE
jgi:hypothetical protein